MPYRPLWYNTEDRTKFNVSFDQPPELDGIPIPPPKPVKPGPEHEHIVSKFVFVDETTGLEYTEYIEPLVSHLRHPCRNVSLLVSLSCGLSCVSGLRPSRHLPSLP
jgi:hypothetical protein